jgi:outer membrane lipase/esterase
LTGSAGIQLRMPFTMKGAFYSPFVDVTAEHDFLGDGRIITTTQSTTLLLPVMTPVNATNQTYGKVVAGIAGQLWGNVSGQINAYSSFARNDGNFYGVNGGIKVAF